ncbi:hypothetical protein EVAR_69121_1 [Eumeta japonica]|uniref:Uncharacterized protein n=1 Tax=Eumeta variegata TaxID=151549 RepID=A0A4C1SJ80_EUMVA|nr:hypothetical protein EVAR_69121_1 [Eumeta japonica]
MCIGTVMTYALSVFAHITRKHYILQGLRTPPKYMGRIERFFEHRGSPMRSLAPVIDYQPPHPSLPSVGLSISQVIDLSSLTHTRLLLTVSGRTGGNRPVTVSYDILCRTIPSGHRPQRMSRAVGTRMCRPATLSEAIKSSDLSSDSSRPTSNMTQLLSGSGVSVHYQAPSAAGAKWWHRDRLRLRGVFCNGELAEDYFAALRP